MSTISIRDGQIFLTNASEVTELTSAIASLVVASLADVEIASLADGQLLQYNSTSGDWENQNLDAIIASDLTEIDGGTY